MRRPQQHTYAHCHLCTSTKTIGTMSDDLDCSRRHGTKTFISASSPPPSPENGNVTNGSALNGHHALRREVHHTSEEQNDDLDTPLSAMQSAAVKTALIINRQPIMHDYVSIEEDVEEECFSRHWIFRRRVGFNTVKSRESDVDRISADKRFAESEPAESDISKLKEEHEKLTKQLESIKQKRRQLRQAHSKLQNTTSEWAYRLSSTQQSYNIASDTLHSITRQKQHIENEYGLLQRWHVLGDTFFIWHHGPFATINGTRLGRAAKTAFTQKGDDNKPSSLFSWGDTHNPQQNISTSLIVPFHEINSAIGQVVFLLYTLQNNPRSGISFVRHILQPCGHVSKIGFLKTNAKQPQLQQHQLQLQHTHYGERRRIFATQDEVTWYNLHHYEENGSYLSMGYYSRRNFNVAIEGLVYCIAEACSVMERRDMALVIPYAISVGGLRVGKEKEKSDGSSAASVGGLSIHYDPEEGERWTAVWRYLLTDLKWLIAYVAKHVDIR